MPGQNGYVEHCIGRDPYAAHPPSLHSIQSLFSFSFNEIAIPVPISTARRYASTKARNGSPDRADRRRRSSADRKT